MIGLAAAITEQRACESDKYVSSLLSFSICLSVVCVCVCDTGQRKAKSESSINLERGDNAGLRNGYALLFHCFVNAGPAPHSSFIEIHLGKSKEMRTGLCRSFYRIRRSDRRPCPQAPALLLPVSTPSSLRTMSFLQGYYETKKDR